MTSAVLKLPCRRDLTRGNRLGHDPPGTDLDSGAEDHVQQGAPQTIVGDGVEKESDAQHNNDHLSPPGERIDQFDR